MKYLEKSLRLLAKNYVILLPFLVATALPGIIERGDVLVPGFVKVFELFKNPGEVRVVPSVLLMLKNIILSQSVGFFGFILKFAAIPATIGMIIKVLDGFDATVDDIIPSISRHFKQYLLYWAGGMALGFLAGIFVLLTGLLIAAITSLISGLKLFFLVVLFFGILIMTVILSVFLCFWFPAMAVDNLNLLDAAKKSFEIAKKSFLLVIGIFTLVNIIGVLVQLLLSVIVGWIPILGSLTIALAPTATTVLLYMFYVIVYRSKTGRDSEFN
ncbi:MAG: hypothetical protein PHV32_06650 [Eubacteriales bacterium]|nr:hypothetical protein [Eubacteriales bacterium]